MIFPREGKRISRTFQDGIVFGFACIVCHKVINFNKNGPVTETTFCDRPVFFRRIYQMGYSIGARDAWKWRRIGGSHVMR